MPQLIRAELRTVWISELYTCLSLLFACPWFRRLWIIQEVVLPEAVDFVFGARSLPRDTMLKPLWIIGDAMTIEDIPDGLNRGALLNIFAMSGIRSEHQRKSQMDPRSIPSAIPTVFAQTRGFAATDPRDRTNGLLGLNYTPGFNANYD